MHPQYWPEDLDYICKRVVIMASGATSVTLVLATADTAAHVMMLQRLPTAGRPQARYAITRQEPRQAKGW